MLKSIRSQVFGFGLAVILPVVLVTLFLPGFSRAVFSTGNFMPHSHCYLNDGRVIWLNVITDLLIGLAYVGISTTLGYLVYKARKDIPFQWMFLAFGLFIISCGGTHFMEVVTVWNPVYWLAGNVKVITAAASVTTAVALPALLPKIFSLIETAKASEHRKEQLEKAHQELEVLNKQLRDLDELKTQFFANVSHELRTPLTLILGPAEKLLNTSIGLSTEQKRDLTVMRRNARVLLKHVNDLLDISKLDAGKMTLSYAQSNLAALLRLICSNFETLAAERKIQFSVDTPTTLVAEIDTEKVERIYMNLLSNAFKFVPDGGKVMCKLRAENGRAIITVADSGPGIPPEHRSNIFKRFHQVEGGDTRRFGGTGLGLSIAEDFVLLHRGRIHVGDAAEGGALFTVELPTQAPAGVTVAQVLPRDEAVAADVQPAVDELLQPAPSPAISSTEQIAHTPAALLPDGAKPTVLVVEDNREMNDFITTHLEQSFRVIRAYDGEEGLQKALASRPDAIISDVMMPRLSGDQLLRRLRAEEAFETTPILMLTARSDDQLRIDLLRHGAQDYITKPFAPEELVARVGNLVAAKISRERLLRANEELEAFSYTVSHDLRAPLRAMRGFSDILLRDWASSLDTVPAQHLRKICDGAARMDRLINDVLSYSRITRENLELTAVDLNKLITELVAENPNLQPPKANVEVIGSIPTVIGHEASLMQCVSNLLENAIKFVAPGTPPRVTVSSENLGNKVRIWFEDNGLGIDRRDHERIFGIFERVHGNRTFVGTGIGLAIVRKAVQRMNGKTGVESEPGKGSRFWIQLQKADSPV
jgi:signal transduction histidine kinase